jgi:aspartyl aminopeptidase
VRIVWCAASQIRDLELSVCDTQPACVGGALNEFIFSPRLDNLMMSYCCLTVPSSSIAPLDVADVLIFALMRFCVCVVCVWCVCVA